MDQSFRDVSPKIVPILAFFWSHSEKTWEFSRFLWSIHLSFTSCLHLNLNHANTNIGNTVITTIQPPKSMSPSHKYCCHNWITSVPRCCGPLQNDRSQSRCSREVRSCGTKNTLLQKSIAMYCNGISSTVSVSKAMFGRQHLKLWILWHLRKEVHFSTTSVSSIMSAEIKISCEMSLIFWLKIYCGISPIFLLVGETKTWTLSWQRETRPV